MLALFDHLLAEFVNEGQTGRRKQTLNRQTDL